MREREIRLIFEYFINTITYLEHDVQQLQQNIRYRRVDAVDCLELCLALERLASFRKFSSEVSQLLKLKRLQPSDD